MNLLQGKNSNKIKHLILFSTRFKEVLQLEVALSKLLNFSSRMLGELLKAKPLPLAKSQAALE
jgi:hypothetical protein